MNNLKFAITAFLGAKASILQEINVSTKFTGDTELSIPKQCFDNIFRYCLLEPERYEYCLCGSIEVIPFEHAVIYDRLDGRYYDPTFEAAGLSISDKKYFLIKQFSNFELCKHAMDFGYAPMLDHCPDLIERSFSFLEHKDVIESLFAK